MPKVNILLVLLAVLIGPLIADRNRETVTVRTWSYIDEITLAGAETPESSPTQLRLRGRHGRDCVAPLQTEVQYFRRNIDVQVYRDLSSTAVCENERAPFTLDLTLEPGNAAYIIVNDQVWHRAPDEAATDVEPGYRELSLAPAHVDGAVLWEPDSQTGEQTLQIRGSQAVGCNLPLIYFQRTTEAGVQIGVFNAIDAETVCPDMLVEVDETVILDATELPADTLFTVNAFQITDLETQTVSDSDKVLTNILSVDVNVSEAKPLQVSLNVEGEHPDGCDYPVLVGQARQGNSIQVEVYREVPADVICPMILRPYKDKIHLDGSFEPGSYSIIVNSHTQTLDI